MIFKNEIELFIRVPIFSLVFKLPVGPAALLVLLAATARAGFIRLGLLPPCRPGQCLARVVANNLVDSSQGFGCLGMALCRRQREQPPGLWVVLGDAFSIFVACLKGFVCLGVVEQSPRTTSNEFH